MMKASVLLRLLFLLALVAACSLVDTKYAVCLVVLFVWVMFVDQKGYPLAGLAAAALGFVLYVLLGATFAGFVLALVPIVLLSLRPAINKSDYWSRAAGPGVYSSVQEAQADRRRSMNNTIRWHHWS